MNHREVADNEIAQLYLNRELSTEDELAFEEHLLHCEECRNHIQLLEATIEEVEIYQQARFRDIAVGKSEIALSKKYRWMSFARIAAVVLLLVGFGGIGTMVLKRTEHESNIPVFTENTNDSLNYTRPVKNSRIIDSGAKIFADTIRELPGYIAENFQTNSFYENLVENSFRDSEVTITSPVKDTLSKIPEFSWEGARVNELTLIIINNKEKKIYVEKIKNGTSPDLSLDPGLYYWQLQDKTGTLITGRLIYLPLTNR